MGSYNSKLKALRNSRPLICRKVVQLLIERGCQYSLRNISGSTPSDYAYSYVDAFVTFRPPTDFSGSYSTSTKDTLEDTVRAQFELNKKARRNMMAQQTAARSNEWGTGSGQMLPPSARPYGYANGTARMRSGSGTSRTTTTSDSGDLAETALPGQSSRSHPSVTSSKSPSRDRKSVV